MLFLLIGLQLPHITSGVEVGMPLVYAAAVLGTLMALRVAWMFVVPAIERLLARGARRDVDQPGPAELAVLGWCGMRGGVSLAAALALPLTAAGHGFPDRDSVIFIAYVAIAATLVIPGLTLPKLVPALGLGETEAYAKREASARVQLAHAALRRVEELVARNELPEPVADQLRMIYELRIHRLERATDENVDHGADGDHAQHVRDLRRDLIRVERQRLSELRRHAEISADARRRIEHDLDLEESRLAA